MYTHSAESSINLTSDEAVKRDFWLQIGLVNKNLENTVRNSLPPAADKEIERESSENKACLFQKQSMTSFVPFTPARQGLGHLKQVYFDEI